MNPQNIQEMLLTGRLCMDKQRVHKHYELAYLLANLCVIPIVVTIIQLFKKRPVIVPGLLLLALFAGFSMIIYYCQKRKLIMTRLTTAFDSRQNYAISKTVLQTLQWIIKEDQPKFIEAYNPDRDFRTWGKEMVSIVLAENEILINSICNVDFINQSFLSFGKNKQNVRRFIDIFQTTAKDIQTAPVNFVQPS